MFFAGFWDHLWLYWSILGVHLGPLWAILNNLGLFWALSLTPSWEYIGLPRVCFGAVLGLSQGLLASGELAPRLSLGVSWDLFGALLGVRPIGLSLGFLEASWVLSGLSWGLFRLSWAFLGLFWALLGPSGDYLGPS